MEKSRYTKKYQRFLTALKQARLNAGLTQTAVGKEVGAHASFVYKCEAGERRVDVVELSEFCRIYGMTVADFLRSAGFED